MPENPLQLLMNPKSIAVVGAEYDPQDGDYSGPQHRERWL